MKQQFALILNSELAISKGFSLDELVFESKKLFDEEGIPGFLRMILLMVDQVLVGHYKGRSSGSCCDDPIYRINRREEKSIHTSCGKLQVNWTRMRCESCRKTLVPLRRYLGLDSYQKKTNELERIVTEVVSEQSYRRSSQHLNTIGSIPVPHTTLHRWVMKSDCDELSMKKRVHTLVADGTGYKKHPAIDPLGQKEVRLIVGVTKEGKVSPYGVWTNTSWRGIGNEIKSANHPNPNLYFKPVAGMLVSDGEEGLIRGLKKLTKEQQRCHWHMPRDLYGSMRVQDKASLQETRIAQKELANIIEVQLPKEDFKNIGAEEKLKLEKTAWEAERSLQKFIDDLIDRGYTQAAKYIINAKAKMFSYVRMWLQTGLSNPRVSSMIERMMREIGRRIKKIGFNWSPEGAAKMTRIIVKRITSANEWEQHWKKKLNFKGTVKLSFEGCVPM